MLNKVKIGMIVNAAGHLLTALFPSIAALDVPEAVPEGVVWAATVLVMYFTKESRETVEKLKLSKAREYAAGRVRGRLVLLPALLLLGRPASATEDARRIIEVTPESLEGFQLISKSADEPEPAPEPEEPAPDPTLLWRALGWATYAACGMHSTAVAYRQDRSGWEAWISSVPGNFAALQGAAQTSNMTTDWIRREQVSDTSAFISRLAVLGACSYGAGRNFYEGWKRR